MPPPKDRVYTEMEALIQHFLIYSQGFTVPAGEAYVPVEGPRGEQGFYVVSDGTNRPWRVKARSPSLLACQALPQMIVGGPDRRRHRRDRLDRRRHGRRGPVTLSIREMIVRYRELHRSKRQMPVDDGQPFVYTPENRERLEAIAKRYPAADRPPVGDSAGAVSRAAADWLHLAQRDSARRGRDRLHRRRRRRRRVVLHDVLHAAGREVRRAGVPHAVVRAARRRAGDRRADGGDWARSRTAPIRQACSR